MADLSAILESSRALTSHLSRRDLPSVKLSLDQIEAQSRRLVSRQPGASNDNDRANYLLAQAHVDAPALADSIAHLNTSTTFSPLQPLHDTDVAGYLRHAHEQNLISTIEEGRRETQEEFRRMLDERGRRDWEARKRRVFEELGGRVTPETKGVNELRRSFRTSTLSQSTTAPLSSNLQMQSKMLAYDVAVTELNKARLRGTSYPIVHSLLKIAHDVTTDVNFPKSFGFYFMLINTLCQRSSQIPQLFQTLSKITAEPPMLPPLEHAGAHILNAPLFERKYARVYVSDQDSKDAAILRKQIAKGSREALEAQYWDIVERTIQARPADAKLGGDPSIANRIRAFLLLRYYRGGDWEERIELVASQPLWAKLFYLVRTGHAQEALDEAIAHQHALDHREPSFLAYFKTWVESPDARLPKQHRDHLQSIYNTHMLNSSTADPFKLALFRLMGKLDPSRRSIPLVTATAEDWLWFQLAMVDEDEAGGLRGLAEVLMNYGERHFDGAPNQRRVGMWANVLLMCGQFEKAVAALDEHQDTKVEAVHLAIALAYHGLLRIPSRGEASDYDILWLSPVAPPALNLAALTRRYVRPFAKHDAIHALQYVACICLSADQGGGIGKEQTEVAWSEVRKIVVLAEGAGWDELVGGLRPDGTRFAGSIEQMATVLMLKDGNDYNDKIVRVAAGMCEQERRTLEAIKLYNIAGAYDTVIACLAQALGECVSQPDGGGEDGKNIEATAREIYYHYSRLNRAAGKERDAVYALLRIREAMAAKEAGRLEAALEAMESTDLIPFDGDSVKLNRRAAEFESSYHDAVKRNLPTYLPLTMEILSGLHQKVKASSFGGDASRKMTLDSLRTKSRSLLMFAGMLKFRMLPDVYSYLARLDVEIAL
ncbi:nucleoporin-interacting protein NIC96 [Rickenella mellea]|uniref:Nuclear pore protein n=1 Tax=Rickenella mellea TaxID=50990 RepID=A0A4Y7QMS2_9AGAM|nr:nucleoporin-interacting protein NIC96 [Rickenella mellea]